MGTAAAPPPARPTRPSWSTTGGGPSRSSWPNWLTRWRRKGTPRPTSTGKWRKCGLTCWQSRRRRVVAVVRPRTLADPPPHPHHLRGLHRASRKRTPPRNASAPRLACAPTGRETASTAGRRAPPLESGSGRARARARARPAAAAAAAGRRRRPRPAPVRRPRRLPRPTPRRRRRRRRTTRAAAAGAVAAAAAGPAPAAGRPLPLLRRQAAAAAAAVATVNPKTAGGAAAGGGGVAAAAAAAVPRRRARARSPPRPPPAAGRRARPPPPPPLPPLLQARTTRAGGGRERQRKRERESLLLAFRFLCSRLASAASTPSLGGRGFLLRTAAATTTAHKHQLVLGRRARVKAPLARQPGEALEPLDTRVFAPQLRREARQRAARGFRVDGGSGKDGRHNARGRHEVPGHGLPVFLAGGVDDDARARRQARRGFGGGEVRLQARRDAGAPELVQRPRPARQVGQRPRAGRAQGAPHLQPVRFDGVARAEQAVQARQDADARVRGARVWQGPGVQRLEGGAVHGPPRRDGGLVRPGGVAFGVEGCQGRTQIHHASEPGRGYTGKGGRERVGDRRKARSGSDGFARGLVQAHGLGRGDDDEHVEVGGSDRWRARRALFPASQRLLGRLTRSDWLVNTLVPSTAWDSQEGEGRACV